MFCYDSPEYVKDMGTPDRYEAVCRDFAEGRVKAKNLKQKQKAVFLDRDGTINKYVGFLRDIDDFELLPGVAEAVKLIRLFKYRLTRLLVCAAAIIGHISKPIKAALRLEKRHTHERRLSMNATCEKKALIEEIQDISASPELYCHNPTRDFSRNRKLPFETLVPLILNMNGGTL